MATNGVDEVDRIIITELFRNARRRSTEDIASVAGVTQSTISKRVRKLEEDGVILGYIPLINYEEAGYPLEVLFTCSAPISQRSEYIRDVFQLDKVIEVRELMAGSENVHIRVVGKNSDDITKIAKAVDNIGFEICQEILVKGDRVKSPEVMNTI